MPLTGLPSTADRVIRLGGFLQLLCKHDQDKIRGYIYEQTGHLTYLGPLSQYKQAHIKFHTSVSPDVNVTFTPVRS